MNQENYLTTKSQQKNFAGQIIGFAGLILFIVTFFHVWSQSIMQNPLIVSAKPINFIELLSSVILLISGTMMIKKQVGSLGQVRWSFSFHLVLSIVMFLIIFYLLANGIQNEPKVVQIIGLLIVSVLSIWFSGYVNYLRLLWFMWFLYGIAFPIFIYSFTWTDFDELIPYLPAMLGVISVVFTLIKLIEMFLRPSEEKSKNKKLFVYGCIFSIIFIILTVVIFVLMIMSVH